MTRITFALAVLFLAAPQSAPETKYTIRIEEMEGIATRPVPAGADQSKTALGPRPEEKLVHQLEVQTALGREFRVWAKHLRETRELTGVIQSEDGEKLILKVDYSVVIPNTEGHSTRLARSQISLKIGQRAQIGGILENVSTTTTGKVDIERRSVFGVWVTLLKESEGR